MSQLRILVTAIVCLNGIVGSLIGAPAADHLTDELLDNLRELTGIAPDDFHVGSLHQRLRRTVINGQSALLFGRHVYTFDGRLYTLPDMASGECVHVLAREHVHHSFTLLKADDSITLITPHLTLTVDTQLRLQLNNSGQYSDFPAQSWDGHVTATRTGTNMHMEMNGGLVVACDTSPFIACVVRVGPLHRNSVVGLLGRNDGDPVTDILPRHGAGAAGSILELVNSYEVSGQPQCQLVSATSQTAPSCLGERWRSCHDWFGQNRITPLSACFSRVEPTPFLTGCLGAARRCDSSDNVKQDMCSVASAYKQVCLAEAGLRVELPNACDQSCGRHSLASSWLVHPTRQVDLVLVTSQQAIPQGTATEMGTLLHKLAHNIKQSLWQVASIHDYRASVVAFGGRTALESPHIHTTDGQPFSSSLNEDVLNDKFRSFPSGTQPNLESALEFATDLPFRYGAVKIIVVVASSSQLTTYHNAPHPTLAERLRDGSILLNIMSPYPVLQARKVLGMTSDSILILEGPKVMSVSGQFPDDSLTGLARETRGFLFDLAAVVDNTHHIYHAIGQHVAQKVSNQAGYCQQCQCTTNSRHEAVARCRARQC